MKKGHLSIKHLETMKKAELQKLAEDLGVSAEGTVKELAARIAEIEVDVPEESELTEEEKAAAEQAAEEERAAKEQQAAEEAAQAAEQANKDAGKVTVEVTTRYLDKRENRIKDAGEIFKVDEERAAQLVGAGVAKIK